MSPSIIAKIREITVRTVAYRVGIGTGPVYRWLNGHAVPEAYHQRLANALGVSVGEVAL